MDKPARSPLGILFLTVFLDLLGFGILIPSLGIYAKHLAQDVGIEYANFAATSLGVVYSLMQFVFAPIWGNLSDRIGRRPVLLISIAGTAIGFLGTGLATSFWGVFAARAFAGAMTSNIAVAQAFIADVTPPDQRARGMGLIGAAFGLGFVLGPAVGGELTHLYGIAAPAYAAAGLSALNLVWALFKLPESRDPNTPPPARRSRLETLKALGGDPKLAQLALLFFLVTFAFANLEQTFSLMLQDKFTLGEEDASVRTGRYLFFVGLLGAILQGGLVGRLVKRFGETSLITFGNACLFLGMIGIAYVGGVWLLLVPLALASIGQGVYTPSVNGLLSRLSDPTRQGETLGLNQSIGALARILGPAWGGVSFDWFGYRAPYLTGAAVMALAFLLSFRLAALVRSSS